MGAAGLNTAIHPHFAVGRSGGGNKCQQRRIQLHVRGGGGTVSRNRTASSAFLLEDVIWLHDLCGGQWGRDLTHVPEMQCAQGV